MKVVYVMRSVFYVMCQFLYNEPYLKISFEAFTAVMY